MRGWEYQLLANLQTLWSWVDGESILQVRIEALPGPKKWKQFLSYHLPAKRRRLPKDTHRYETPGRTYVKNAKRTIHQCQRRKAEHEIR